MSEGLPGPAGDWVKIWKASGRELSGSEQMIELLVESEDPQRRRVMDRQERRESRWAMALCVSMAMVSLVLLWKVADMVAQIDIFDSL